MKTSELPLPRTPSPRHHCPPPTPPYPPYLSSVQISNVRPPIKTWVQNFPPSQNFLPHQTATAASLSRPTRPPVCPGIAVAQWLSSLTSSMRLRRAIEPYMTTLARRGCARRRRTLPWQQHQQTGGRRRRHGSLLVATRHSTDTQWYVPRDTPPQQHQHHLPSPFPVQHHQFKMMRIICD